MQVKRLIALIFFFMLGTGMLVYGLFYHRVSIEVEKQREISIAVPNREMGGGMPTGPQGPNGMGGMPPGGGPMGNAPGPPPPPAVKMETVFETYVESQPEREWTIVKEITFGGIARLANGELKRTYSGKPPALCPT